VPDYYTDNSDSEEDYPMAEKIPIKNDNVSRIAA